jgi:hypothetical protein
LPATLGVPFSCLSVSDIRRLTQERGVVANVSGTIIWRWLSADAIRPWCHRSCIFPRDPAFAEKAARVLDLYSRRWEGAPLQFDEYVLLADEKTGLQALARRHPGLPRGRDVAVWSTSTGAAAPWPTWPPGTCTRTGSLAASRKRRAPPPFGRLVDQVVRREPYRSAGRLFFVVDNGTSHRGRASVERAAARYSNLILVHLPIHASWLNQIEIYFSVVQRKVLTPNDFDSLTELAERLEAFQAHYQKIATPFDWRFSREDLDRLLGRLHQGEAVRTAA